MRKGLLKELAEKHVMVEINLSSNDGILGIKGAEHPFPIYRAAHVPVALSTDDEGVSRIDITHEYVRAALDYHLSYAGFEASWPAQAWSTAFCRGRALGRGGYFFRAGRCRAGRSRWVRRNRPADCKVFSMGARKAAAQWELERRFRAFEGRY